MDLDRVVYVRTWCLGKCGRYTLPRVEPKRCGRCGSTVLCVPVTQRMLRSKVAPS